MSLDRLRPVLLLPVPCGALSAPARCPDPAQWARDFRQPHAGLHGNRDRHDPAPFTPGFGVLLQRGWACAGGEPGHLDHDRWPGAQDGEMADAPVSEVAPETPDGATVAMTCRFADAPGKPLAVQLRLQREAARCWLAPGRPRHPRGESLTRLYSRPADQPGSAAPRSA